MQPPSISKLGMALVITATSTVVIVASAYTLSSPFMEEKPQGTPDPATETDPLPVVYKKIAPLKTVSVSSSGNQRDWLSGSYRPWTRKQNPTAIGNSTNDSSQNKKEERGQKPRQAETNTHAPGHANKPDKKPFKVSVNLPNKKPRGLPGRQF